MKNICIIPARGGSKRIPRKNIKTFYGKPMIQWSIEAAMKASVIDEVVISTDDEEIANISKSLGAKVPFIRPDILSGDTIGTTDVVLHAINFLEINKHVFENVCCLYATAPFIISSDLDMSFRALQEIPTGRFVFSAGCYQSPIQRALRINEDGFSQVIDPSNIKSRTQDLPPTYFDAGQFYWASKKTWQKHSNIFEHGKLYVLPPWRVCDIDSPRDWQMAEIIFNISRELGDY